jgi:hypothetical protein
MNIQDTAEYHLPDIVLDCTEDKVGVIIGGNKTLEHQRELLKALLCMKRLDWITAEAEGNQQKIHAAAKLIEGKSYDLVFFLARWAGHQMNNVIMPAARKAAIPVFKITTGSGINSFTKAIEEQKGSAING